MTEYLIPNDNLARFVKKHNKEHKKAAKWWRKQEKKARKAKNAAIDIVIEDSIAAHGAREKLEEEILTLFATTLPTAHAVPVMKALLHVRPHLVSSKRLIAWMESNVEVLEAMCRESR